jgi:competence protein ComEC
VLVDAGGIPFGGGTFDVGSRVLSPALWARGVRGLPAVALTHGDPDHIGGARAIVEDFAPERLWEGVPVERHAPLQQVLHLARQSGAAIGRLTQGDEWWAGGARVRVLHPPAPDWERRRVRNDDSLVFEVLYGDVALLLPGDIGADVERTLLPQLTMARHRILKVAHHGSRTSTSRELLAHWRPQVAIISAGRGNTFGHPTPDVLARLASVGARIYRTDLDGQIDVDTDGSRISVSTYIGRKHEGTGR